LLRCATVDDPRFVEVDVALDETRTGKPTLCIVNLCFRGKSRLYCYDAAIGDCDVREFVRPSIRQSRIADDEIHRLPSL
jgi:hypothetical protein